MNTSIKVSRKGTLIVLVSLDTIFHVNPKLRLTMTIANLSETQLYTGEPVNVDGNRKAEESEYIRKLETDLSGYVELVTPKLPK